MHHIMKPITISLVALAIFLQFGCASVSARVTGITDSTFDVKGKTYSYKFKSENDIERKKYEALFDENFNKIGMIKSIGVGGFYQIEILWSIDNGRDSTSAMPLMGQTGGGTTHVQGAVYGSNGGMATYSGSTYSTPTYGVVGYIPVTSTSYCRRLGVRFYHAETLVYDGRVVSSGSTGEIYPIMPSLVSLFFKVFPNSGSFTKEVYLVEWPKEGKDIR